jgi:hypothetical protein
MPNIRECYDLYHDKGFEVIGLSCDRKRADLEAFVKERKIPWAILFGDDKPSPTVEYYGVMVIPTMILVGKEGRVVALNVRGDELGKELTKLLGPVKAKDEAPESKEKAKEKDKTDSAKEKPESEKK